MRKHPLIALIAFTFVAASMFIGAAGAGGINSAVPVRATSHLSKGESGSSAVPTTNLRWLAVMVRERACRHGAAHGPGRAREVPAVLAGSRQRPCSHSRQRAPAKEPAPGGLARVAAIQRTRRHRSRSSSCGGTGGSGGSGSASGSSRSGSAGSSGGSSRSGGTSRTSSTSSAGGNGSPGSKGGQGGDRGKRYEIDKSREGGPDRKATRRGGSAGLPSKRPRRCLAGAEALRIRRQLRRGHRKRVLRRLSVRAGDVVGARLLGPAERRLTRRARPSGREAPSRSGLGAVAGLQRGPRALELLELASLSSRR